MASGEIAKCVHTGEGGEGGGATCKDELVVTVTVPGGKQEETDYLTAELNAISDGEYGTKTLARPIKVAIRKSDVHATYPLQYIKAFNANPGEAVEITGSGRRQSTCSDSPTDMTPTCGWHYSSTTGLIIPDSQGFCCSCSAGDAIDHSIDGRSNNEYRANLDCNVFRTGLPLQASAHCMVHGSEWYSGYSVGEPSLDFDINIDISLGKDEEGGEEEETFSSSSIRLGPDAIVNATADGTVRAELLGDLVSYRSFPELSGKYLMIPPETSVGYLPPPEDWLMVDRSLVTLDGSQCDKIGVGFTAFRMQAMRCQRRLTSCLANQITDLVQQDQGALTAGRPPTYLLRRWGENMSIKRYEQSTQYGRVRLAVPVSSAQNSVITLTLDASDLVFIQNVSPGQIISAGVGDYSVYTNSSLSGTFEGLSGSGTAVIEIQNVGTLPSEYHISIFGCTEGVNRVVSPGPQFLSPNEKKLLHVPVSVVIANADAGHRCLVHLLSAQGELWDEEVLDFNTTAITQQGVTTQSGQADLFSGVNGPRAELTCADHCPLIINIFCLLVHRCGKQIMSLIIIIAVLCIAVVSLFRCCGLSSCGGCCGIGASCLSFTQKRRQKKDNRYGYADKSQKKGKRDNALRLEREDLAHV